MARLLCGVYCGDHAGEMQTFADWIGARPDLASVHGGEDNLDAFIAVDFDLGVHEWNGPKCISLPLIWGGVTLADAAAGLCDEGWKAGVLKLLNQQSIAGVDGYPKTDVVYVRIGWEQNAGWMQWATQNNGQEPAFVTAFRRLVGILRAADTEGRTRIVWCPNIGQEPAENTYPGDDCVDVVALDFYWQPEFGAPADPVEAFAYMRTQGNGLDWQVAFAKAHGKGLAVAEWGVEQDDAAPYIDAAFAFFVANEYIYANYWDSDAAFKGKLSPDVVSGASQYPAAAAAYRSAVRAIQGVDAAAVLKAVPPVVLPVPAAPVLVAEPSGITLTLSAALLPGTYTLTPQ